MPTRPHISSDQMGEPGVNSPSTNDVWAPLSFEAHAKAQDVGPIRDFQEWMNNLPKVEIADELVSAIEASRGERQLERNSRDSCNSHCVRRSSGDVRNYVARSPAQ
jgi:hypothetical protein